MTFSEDGFLKADSLSSNKNNSWKNDEGGKESYLLA